MLPKFASCFATPGIGLLRRQQYIYVASLPFQVILSQFEFSCTEAAEGGDS